MLEDRKELNKVRLYVVEEQEIWRYAYQSFMNTRTSVELLRVSTNGDISTLKTDLSELRPDVLLFNPRRLDVNIIEELEQIRTEYPKIGIVLLVASYHSRDIEQLRRLMLKGGGGMALFLKQSLDRIDQLLSIILAVSQGQVVLDATLTTPMFAGKPENPFLKQLTARELEILTLLSQGYTNSAIAATLFIDIKTVEHHLNSMYSKLKADSDFNGKHLRVSAASIYLETTGSRELHQKSDSYVR
jgi:DNA-binding NarL/FixJ family response regulator